MAEYRYYLIPYIQKAKTYALSHSILMETPETGVALITLNFI